MRNLRQQVTIKRYGNCRLYDATAAAYVTADEVAALADGEQDVVVLDAKTGEDITDLVLMKHRLH